MAISATVTPGATLSDGETVTISKLNALGTPTVDIAGAVGSLAIASGSIANEHVQTGAAIQYDKLGALATNQLVVGNAGTPTATTLTGDIGISAAGLVTIEDDAVTTDKIIDNAVDGAKIAMGSDAEGDVLYHNGTDYVRLPKGTAEQLLKMNSAADAPEWSSVHAPNIVQTIFTGTKSIYNHSTSSYSSVEGTQGDQDAFYLLYDGTSDFDSTITRRALDSKVKIEFQAHVDVNTGRGWWGKIQRSLNDGTDWADTVVGDVGPGGASDLRRSVQFGGAYINNAYSMEPVSLCYVDTPAGGTGEEAVRYRIIVGTEAGYHMYVNYDSSEGVTPAGDGGTHLIRTTSSMLLTEIPV